MSKAIPTAKHPAEVLEVLIDLHFPSRPDRLKLVRSAVLTSARMCGFDEIAANDIVLAVNEACQNVMTHAYAGSQDGTVELTVFRRTDGIGFQLRDFAPTVNPATVKPRDLDFIVPGGLGTHFIRSIMDETEFVPVPDDLPEGVGNILEMIKRTGS